MRGWAQSARPPPERRPSLHTHPALLGETMQVLDYSKDNGRGQDMIFMGNSLLDTTQLGCWLALVVAILFLGMELLRRRRL